MAIQELTPLIHSTPQSRISEALSTGLGKTLEGLAQQKANQLMQFQRGKALEPFFPGMGNALGALDKDTLESLLKGNFDLSKGNQGGLQRKPTESQQTAIEGRNEPYNKIRRTQSQYAQDLEPLLDEVIGYDEADKLREGWSGFAPGFALEPEEQRANEIYTKIASLRDSSEGSVRSNYQTQLKQATKPALWKDKKTRKYAYRDLKRVVNGIKLEDDVAEKIIADNNNIQPRNLETIVNKQVKVIEKKKSQLPSNGNKGDIAVDENTGLPEFQFDGSDWQWIGEL